MTARRGFTLTEALVVLTIIALLTRLGIPRYVDMRARATARVAIADVGAIRLASANYHADQNRWPTDAASGTIPPGLQSYLRDGFSFARSDYSLDWDLVSMMASGSAIQVPAVSVWTANPRVQDALRALALGVPHISSNGKSTFLLGGITTR
jgi:prepilin-type N-terminal cleavage/methylation domain-containing protein